MHDHTDNRHEILARGKAFIAARRELDEGCYTLDSLIMGVIADGCTTRDDIIKTVPKLIGHRYAHVAVVLDEGTGDDPAEYYWFRDETKRYDLHVSPNTPAGDGR